MLSDISYSSFSNQGESEALSDKKDLTCNSEGEMIGVSYIISRICPRCNVYGRQFIEKVDSNVQLPEYPHMICPLCGHRCYHSLLSNSSNSEE
jgi:hypothetical protein